jgi:hypothetical protein
MKSTRNIACYMVFACAALLLAACANQMEPARNALADINVALDSVSADAKKYIPDQLTAVQSKVAELTASFDKKDYAAVLTGAPPVLAEVRGLVGAAAAKKDEIAKALSNEWAGLAASVPQVVDAVNARVDTLSQARRVPKDIDLTAAKSGLADAKAQWETAQSAFKSGNVADAVTAAKDTKAKAESAATALKLTLPEAGK